MKKLILSVSVLFLATTGWAQKSKKEQDIAAIKAMTGCYRVTFNFIETFNYSKDSTYTPSKEKHDTALEWVTPLTDKSNLIQLQHLLIVGKKDQPHIVKHWRQDWLYQNQDLYKFDKENHWKYKHLTSAAVKGQWTQKVFQVDDSPRYEGTATWVHYDGKSYWENTTDAPLPRRERKRTDYNVTTRKNRQEIVNNGWVHDQYNKKVIRKTGKPDVVLAEEKGYNTYVKIDDSNCLAAQEWWKEHRKFWKKVRGKWTQIFNLKEDIQIQTKQGKGPLYSQIFKLKSTASKKEISNAIDSYLK